VHLPITTKPAPKRDNEMTGDTQAAPTKKRRILVVDDNKDSASSLSLMLKIMGNETKSVFDGLAAVEAAGEFLPEIILLDIGLPKLNGYDACRAIREQPWSEGMYIIALTGWGQDEDRRRSAEAGFDHHLVKPVEMAILQKLFAEMHGSRKTVSSNSPSS
jgi:CheY-like chemotaxis protein